MAGGPLTATQAGRLLGESSGTCSFHLRQQETPEAAAAARLATCLHLGFPNVTLPEKP